MEVCDGDADGVCIDDEFCILKSSSGEPLDTTGT